MTALNRHTRSHFWLSIMTSLACAVGGSVPYAAWADDILIGASLPLSGPNAAAGNEGLTDLGEHTSGVAFTLQRRSFL